MDSARKSAQFNCVKSVQKGFVEELEYTYLLPVGRKGMKSLMMCLWRVLLQIIAQGAGADCSPRK